jgi:hypothetical protein
MDAVATYNPQRNLLNGTEFPRSPEYCARKKQQEDYIYIKNPRDQSLPHSIAPKL